MATKERALIYANDAAKRSRKDYYIHQARNGQWMFHPLDNPKEEHRNVIIVKYFEEDEVTEQRKAFEEWAKQNLKHPLLKWSDEQHCYVGIESNAAWKAWKYLTDRSGDYKQ